MKDKLGDALKRLNAILPLKECQESCDPTIKALHQQVLWSFVTKGRALTKEEMSSWVNDVPAAVEVLVRYDMVTFSEKGELIGAYPFTMEEREHSVHVNGYWVHTMCALDALAVAPMFEKVTQITSKCRFTNEPISIQMDGELILNWDEVVDVHFGIAWDSANSDSCCADSLCMEMIFLRDECSAQKWLSVDSVGREIFTLREAVQFASRFFTPLLS